MLAVDEIVVICNIISVVCSASLKKNRGEPPDISAEKEALVAWQCDVAVGDITRC